MKKDKKPTKLFTFRFDEELIEQFDIISRDIGITRTVLLRDMIISSINMYSYNKTAKRCPSCRNLSILKNCRNCLIPLESIKN
jgi:hypothetical protein